MQTKETFGAIVIGTGFSGLAIATEMKRNGMNDFVLLERADEVGGTWRDNTYPGAACDIPSHLYSFSFRPNPAWNHVYARQPEIHAYLCSVATDEGLRPHIRFGHTVTRAAWDGVAGLWTVTTGKGSFSARALVCAPGHLSDPAMPDIPGIGEFTGHLFHSARWDHATDLTGKRVALIGTGASAIQIVPELAGTAGHLTVFQRSAPYIVPRRDRAYSAAEKRMFARVPETAQDIRDENFWYGEDRFMQRRRVPSFIQRVQRMAEEHLAAQVPDPDLRRRLTPDYEIGCKRILLSNDYYPALQKPNVTLETAGILRIEGNRILCRDGTEHEVDVLVMATGFEATEMPITEVIYGTDGRRLADDWADGGRAHACTTVPGYPNFFVMLGPNTGLGSGSMVYMAETQATYIRDALAHILTKGVAIEPDAASEARFMDHLYARTEGTVWVAGGCKSWYLHPSSGKLTALWPDFMHRFRQENGVFDPENYQTRLLAVQPA